MIRSWRPKKQGAYKAFASEAKGIPLICLWLEWFCHLHFVGCNGGDYIGHSSDARSDVPRVEGFHAVVSDLKCGTAADGNGETVAYG